MTAADVSAGRELAGFERTPDPMDLFLYSASVWLPHRIHYDEAYTTDVEGHPALLVQGPLQGVYLMQVITTNFPEAVVTNFVFRHQVPVYVNQTLRCRGRVATVDETTGTFTCELWTELDDGRQATVAQATLRLPVRAGHGGER